MATENDQNLHVIVAYPSLIHACNWYSHTGTFYQNTPYARPVTGHAVTMISMIIVTLIIVTLIIVVM